MKDIRQFDFGTTLRITLTKNGAPADVSAATVKEIAFKKPSGSTVRKTADFTGTGDDGQIEYIYEESFIDEYGPWERQAFVTDETTFGYSSKPEFFMVGPLTAPLT